MEANLNIKEHIESLLSGKLLDSFSIGKDAIRGVYVDFETGMVLVTDGIRRTPLAAFSQDEIQDIRTKIENLLHQTFKNTNGAN